MQQNVSLFYNTTTLFFIVGFKKNQFYCIFRHIYITYTPARGGKCSNGGIVRNIALMEASLYKLDNVYVLSIDVI